MKLFGRTGRTFTLSTCFLILTLLLAACGSANTGSSTPTASKAPGQGCNTIGVSLPETNTSYRWDNQDKPALLKDIQAALPSAKVL